MLSNCSNCAKRKSILHKEGEYKRKALTAPIGNPCLAWTNSESVQQMNWKREMFMLKWRDIRIS